MFLRLRVLSNTSSDAHVRSSRAVNYVIQRLSRIHVKKRKVIYDANNLSTVPAGHNFKVKIYYCDSHRYLSLASFNDLKVSL